MDKLSLEFYLRNDVLQVAKELLGKVLVTNFKNKRTAGRIVEVEAYNGIIDKASHAYNDRRTKRTETMYAEGGAAYIYLCYGIHHLFNVVTNKKNVPHAILIRAVEPVFGIDLMMKRTNKKRGNVSLSRGPGNLSKAFGLSTLHNEVSLTDDEIYIVSDGVVVSKNEIIATPRIGVDYAGKDALLPYRFIIKDNPFVSGN